MRSQVRRLVHIGSDMSLRQMHVLFELLDGERTIKDLHEASNAATGRALTDKPTVTRAVDRLADTGFVKRKEHPTDRRFVLVSLTPTGRRFAEAAQQP
jgi:DNA-binding MarR family transcriptional regulator